jgi:hypothetical protein
LSGSAYEFLRNGALNSRNHFAPTDVPAPDYDGSLADRSAGR